MVSTSVPNRRCLFQAPLWLLPATRAVPQPCRGAGRGVSGQHRSRCAVMASGSAGPCWAPGRAWGDWWSRRGSVPCPVCGHEPASAIPREGWTRDRGRQDPLMAPSTAGLAQHRSCPGACRWPGVLLCRLPALPNRSLAGWFEAPVSDGEKTLTRQSSPLTKHPLPATGNQQPPKVLVLGEARSCRQHPKVPSPGASTPCSSAAGADAGSWVSPGLRLLGSPAVGAGRPWRSGAAHPPPRQGALGAQARRQASARRARSPQLLIFGGLGAQKGFSAAQESAVVVGSGPSWAVFDAGGANPVARMLPSHPTQAGSHRGKARRQPPAQDPAWASR